ncbi:MAG TPA: hypothetical protein VHG09_12035 [Longimicrobiales bacterium]|nr:hypothetical protein [Longimicrobiales bacterium]
MRDTMQVRIVEQAFVRSAASAAGLERDRAAAISGVAAGLAALRIWEITGERTHARRSRSHFDRAARLDEANAWAHYGHALSLEAEMDREPGRIVTHINAARDLGLDPVSRARRALERAVALDPSLPGATDLLARYARDTRDEDGLILARTSFQMAAAASHSPTALLGVARTARDLGEHIEAVDAARRATELAPASAQAHLQLAMSLAMIDDSLPAAGLAYDAALSLADSTMVKRLWEEAEPVHGVIDSIRWRMAAPEEKRTVVRTFWDIRGALSGLTGGERAAEHYRRIAIASRDFHRRGMFGAAPENAMRLRKTSASYDDRGVIFIRHGEPERTHGAPPLENYIAWFYTDESGDPLSYHFYRSDQGGSSKDYLLMRNLPCALDPSVAAFDHRLAPLAYGQCDPLRVRSISAEINRDAERALHTDSHSPDFDLALPFHFDWYTFRAPAGTELLMAVGVPLDELPPELRAVRMQLSLVDTMRMAIANTSRTTAQLPADVGADEGDRNDRILRTHLGMTMQPGPRVYRIDVRDAADPRTGAIYGGEVKLPDYSGDTIMVSDVMLAEQSDSGRVIRGDSRLALAPTQVFRNGEFRVYYEIYNMPADAPFSTELTIEPLTRGGLRDRIRQLFGGEDAVRVGYEDTAAPDASGTFRQVRDMTVPFREGEWLLRLTITTPDGTTLTRERRFMIEED